MMTTPALARKRRHSSGPVPALDWGAIFIISMACGLTWMSPTLPKQTSATAFKTGTRDSPGRCPAQVIIHHFDLAPAQLPQAILHGVLQFLAFQIVIDLVHGRLTNVQHRLALQMLWLDLVTHALSPFRVGRSGFSGNVRAAVALVAPRLVV